MKNNDSIVVETIINAPVSKVWCALTKKDEMKKWYFDLKEFKPITGFEFQFYGGTEERQYLHLCRVLEANTDCKLSHTWAYENVPIDTVVTWNLSLVDKAQTSVQLIHSGVDDLPKENKDFNKENFVAGWNHLVKTALKNYLENE